jgi:hypothetical protein
VVRCRPGIATNSGFLGAELRLAVTASPTSERAHAALFRPHSRADAISAPSRIDLSLSQTTGSITHSRRVKVRLAEQSLQALEPNELGESEAAIGRSDDALAVADRGHHFLDPPRHHFRMLDEIAG